MNRTNKWFRFDDEVVEEIDLRPEPLLEDQQKDEKKSAPKSPKKKPGKKPEKKEAEENSENSEEKSGSKINKNNNNINVALVDITDDARHIIELKEGSVYDFNDSRTNFFFFLM